MAPGIMPKKVETTKRRSGTSRKAGHEVGDEEGHHRHQADQEQHRPLVLVDAVLDLLDDPFGAFEARGEAGAYARLRGKEDCRGADGRGCDVEKRAGEGREEEPARQRGDGRARQREGDDQRVDGDEDGDGANVVGIPERNQRLAVLGQGREAEVIAQEEPAEHRAGGHGEDGEVSQGGRSGCLGGLGHDVGHGCTLKAWLASRCVMGAARDRGLTGVSRGGDGT
jgi:hypothetical protein